jgi:hypothetical protein
MGLDCASGRSSLRVATLIDLVQARMMREYGKRD